MHQSRGKVFILDQDPSVCKALSCLFASAGLQAEIYRSGHEFLAARKRAQIPMCLVLDLKTSDINGLELQEKLGKDTVPMPVVFLTGYGDIPSSVRAMKQGAVAFLSKPVEDHELMQAVEEGLAQDASRKRYANEVEYIRQRMQTLTVREQEVLIYVISGLLNKQIASLLHVSEKTVKVHRARIMHKMKAGSVAALVRMAFKAGINPVSDMS